jgi:methylase of polypeptide subunit release factors
MTDTIFASGAEQALTSLLAHLHEAHYRFVTTTPLTHARVLARQPAGSAATLRDVFGWNLPFEPDYLPAQLLATLDAAGLLGRAGQQWRSKVRVSSIDDALFLHSAYPTDQENAVFFGPDTYRYVRFMQEALALAPLGPQPRILDIGCGSGAGGLMVAKQVADATLVLNDINPEALVCAGRNAQAAGIAAQLALGDSLAAVDGQFDLIMANPPYLVDDDARTYRHGGDRLGRSLSLRMATQSLPRLAPGGRLLLYTGIAIVRGVDEFLLELKPALDGAGLKWRYQELDPDVFGEELERDVYREVDRIAAVGLEARRPS